MNDDENGPMTVGSVIEMDTHHEEEDWIMEQGQQMTIVVIEKNQRMITIAMNRIAMIVTNKTQIKPVH
jgi:hypothetical protein